MNTLENTITTMGLLSKEAYNVGNFQIGAEITANNQTYKVIDYVSTASDFQALLLQDESGKFVMAFRGTERDSTLDWLNNAGIGLANINEQYNDAKEFLEKAMKDYGVTIDNLTLTGHSLGGILTQQVGATYGIKGYAFNPYGTDRLLSLPSSLSTGIASNILLEKVMSAVGLTKANAQWAYEHIYNISYQDEGALNGDILSNFATELSSNHLGHFIPILGENVGFGEGHYMGTLNTAIAEYNDIVQKFDNSCRYEDITNMYLSTAIIHGSGYKKVRDEFKKLGILNKNGANDKIANNSLHLEVIAKDTDTTSIFSGSNLSTPALYALVNLNPFIVSNINSNAYSELERYKDDFTKGYIEDKAKMFKAALTSSRTLDNKYYQDNISGIKIKPMFDNTGIVSSGDIKEQYYFGSNERDIITINSNGVSSNAENKIYTLAGDDTIIASKGNNYIEAGSGSDVINLSKTSKNSKNIVYGDTKDNKHSDNKNNDNDIIIGGAGVDTIFGGRGKDIYYVEDKDIITDDKDGEGEVYFKYTKLTGGTYDKEKGCYINGDIQYHLNGNTLIVKQGKEAITINNFNKDLYKTKGYDYLGIELLKEEEIVVTISDNSSSEGDNGKKSMRFKISLNRKLKDEEYVIVNINDKSFLFGNPGIDSGINKADYDTSGSYIYKWEGNTTKNEDINFEVTGTASASKGLIIKEVKSGNGTIIDDDRDDDPEDVDPIIIDLNKNGITSTKLNNTIYFDHDNNNFKEASSWIDKGDAFLALDKNSNGLIDNGNELFGNHTISNTKYGEKEANNKDTSINGYEALKAYDLNGDNVIDSKDEIYDKLLLWKDSNQNAITDKGELIKLKDSGIVSIDLNYKNTSIYEKGNTIKQSSTVTFEDGSTTIANDVWFK